MTLACLQQPLGEDALDALTFAFVATERQALVWPAWLAVWERIGRDYAAGWVLWASLGQVGRNAYPVPSREQRAEARAFLCSQGFDFLFV